MGCFDQGVTCLVWIPSGLASWAVIRSPFAAATKAAFSLFCRYRFSPLPGYHPAPDRVPPTREAPPYQRARNPGSTSVCHRPGDALQSTWLSAGVPQLDLTGLASPGRHSSVLSIV